MTSSTTTNPDDADLTAAEFVLGTLSDAERRTLETRFAYYPQWRMLVGHWADRLLPLAEAIAPVTPSPALRARIMAATKAVPFTSTRNWPRAASWWKLIWASAAVAVLTVALMLWQQVPRPTEIAALGDADNPKVVSIAATPEAHEIVVSAGLPLPPERKSFELWVIPADGTPRSLGIIAGATDSTLRLPAMLRPFIARDSVLAISIEPIGGSPTGLPTGPVVLSGKIVSASRN